VSAPLFNGGGADHAVGDPNYGHRSAWGLVAALTLVNVIAQVDRFAMTLLITPMQRDLGLNDTQMGLIGGLVTGVFFAAAGLPLARLADQVNRKYLIIVSLVGWSLMTMASGLAIGFWTLCLARLLLSVGEASLGPAANSMISNVFPSNRLSQPLSVFAAAGSLGNAVASGLVALLLAFAAWAPDLLTFGDASMAPWRIVMLGLGLAGVVPLVGMLLVREPARPVDDARPGFKAFVAHLRPRWKAYAPCYLGYAFFVLPFVALAFWVPTAFERTHGMSTTTSGVWLGLGYLVAGTPGTLVGGWLAQRWLAAGRTDGNLRVLLLATCIALPAAALSQIVGNPTVGLGFVWVGMFSAAMGLGPVTAAIQALTPVPYRAQAAAVLYLLIYIVAFMGIPLAGAITDGVFHDPKRIGHALAVLAVAFGLLASWVILRGLRPHRMGLAEREAALRQG
jgi:MFS family permease